MKNCKHYPFAHHTSLKRTRNTCNLS